MPPDDNVPPEGEKWTEIGDAPPNAAANSESAADPPPPAEAEEQRAYSGKQPTAPWKISLSLGVAGFLMMLIVFIFPELRRFNAPWDPSYPIAHFILLVPIFGLLFAVIGLLGQEYREDRSKAARGLVLGLATIALGIAVIATDPALDAEAAAATDERLDMNEEELRDWRIEKLDR